MTQSNLPTVKSTMDERIKALQVAKPLLSTATTPLSSQSNASVTDLIRLAEYITTGHDYNDTHTRQPKL